MVSPKNVDRVPTNNVVHLLPTNFVDKIQIDAKCDTNLEFDLDRGIRVMVTGIK